MLIQKKMNPRTAIRSKAGYKFRYVWDRRQMIEKIKIFDAGLNDRVMEAYKFCLNRPGRDKQSSGRYDSIYFDGLDLDKDVIFFDFISGGRAENKPVIGAFYRDVQKIIGGDPTEKPEWSIVDEDYGKNLYLASRGDSLATPLIAHRSYDWRRVYQDEDVTIDMNTAHVSFGENGIGRVTFRWTWTVPRQLKMTPGVSYKSRTEVLELDCTGRRFHTSDVTLFDINGKPICFDNVVPSSRWDSVVPGSIIEKLFKPACDLLQEKRWRSEFS